MNTAGATAKLWRPPLTKKPRTIKQRVKGKQYMHEAGIAYLIIRQVESVCSENKLTSVVRVTVELGEVSGIVEDYLTSVWDWAVKKNELLKGAKLLFEQIDAVTICNSCGTTYATVPQGKQCPRCQSYDTVLLRGNECIIREIEAC